MATISIRQALGAAAVLALLVASPATADTVGADGDSASGVQTFVNLGSVEAGTEHAVDVDFVLSCQDLSHLAAGSTIDIVEDFVSVPNDGQVDVSPGTIEVPGTWPASNQPCPTDATPVTSTTPAHIVVTAPTATGPAQEFDVFFVPQPDTGGVSNSIAFAILMDVVDAPPSGDPPPADTTPPVLHGVPDSMTVTTTSDSAVVSWPEPTATDDTDPSPTVSCAPDSGSTFGLGTTTVTCTATDASGNSASESFAVTVVDPPALVGSWGRPLDDSTPALVGRRGRTVPLKLTVTTADGAVQGPSDIAAPNLMVTALDGCDVGATAVSDQAGGVFAWNNGRWRLNLRTTELEAGCWRLTAMVNGETLAPAVVIRLEDGPVKAGAAKHADQAAKKAAHAAAVAAKKAAHAAAVAAKHASKPSAGRHQH